MDPTTEKEHVASSYQSSFSSEESLYMSPPKENIIPHPAIPTTVLQALSDDYLTVNRDGLVDFAYASPSHPRQWSLYRKLYDTTIICLLEFVTTVISNAGSNIAEQVSEDFGIPRELAIFCTATLYLLGQAIGGLIFPPVTEVFGSRLLYAGSTGLYAALCLMTGLAPSLATVITGRLFCGMLSAMPTCVATGSVENIWDSRARIWGVASWAASGVFAMAIGPLYAVYVSDSQLGWPWVFVLAGIVCGVLSLLCLTMQESRPSQVLRQRVKKIGKSTKYTGLRIEGASLPTLGEFVRDSLTLPIRLFLTEPVVLVSSIMGATVVGLTYLFAEAIPVVYSHDFGMTRNEAALVFLILGAGVLCFILPRLYDVHMANTRHARHQSLQPEDKLSGFLAAAPLLAIGLWWFGATIPPMAPRTLSPAVSMVPVAFVGFAAVEFDTVLAGYLTDVYNSHAASANSPMCFLRALMSGLYPLFGRQMFLGLGSSGASFVLAGMATAYVGVAVCFWKYGGTIRRKSKFAEESRIAGDVDAE